MNAAEPHLYRWTQAEYYKLCEEEWFQGKRVQLINGEIIETLPFSNFHAIAMACMTDALRKVFGPDYWVRPRATLDLVQDSCPDPDLAVVPGPPRTWLERDTPTSALLVVEVSDTTLAYDRDMKACMHAASGIPDYWIVNIPNHQLEVYRDPVADSTQRFGFRYDTRTILVPGDFVTPLALPAGQVAVADLLP